MTRNLNHRGSKVTHLLDQADGPIAEEEQEEIVAQLEAEVVMFEHICCSILEHLYSC